MNRATRWLCWIIPRSWSEISRCWGLLDGCETAPLAPLNGDNGRQNYPNILENKTINEYCNNWHLFQKNNVFEKCFKFDIILSHVMISDNAKKKLWGFKFSNGKKIHPRRGLGLQAFGLGGDHCEGRLFSWSLDRGALASGLQCPPPKNHLGKQIPMEKWEISGDFSMGKKKTHRWFVEVYYRDYFYPSSLKNSMNKKILPIFTPRSWRNPLVMECQSAAMHVVDSMRWSITLAVLISMSTGNMRDESGTNIRWFLLGGIFGWDFFLGRVRWVKNDPEIRH